MPEREEARPLEDKGRDYKAPVVEEKDYTPERPEGVATVTVQIVDADGNIMLEHKGVAAAFVHVMKVNDEGEVTMNAGTVHADEEDLADLAEFMGDHYPVWLNDHPSVAEVIKKRLPKTPKVL